jgi:hypothetical protein
MEIGGASWRYAPERTASRGGLCALQWLCITGTLSGDFGDARVRGTTRAGHDLSAFVGEHAREALRDVRPAVIAHWHVSFRQPPVPVTPVRDEDIKGFARVREGRPIVNF